MASSADPLPSSNPCRGEKGGEACVDVHGQVTCDCGGPACWRREFCEHFENRDRGEKKEEVDKAPEEGCLRGGPEQGHQLEEGGAVGEQQP